MNTITTFACRLLRAELASTIVGKSVWFLALAIGLPSPLAAAVGVIVTVDVFFRCF